VLCLKISALAPCARPGARPDLQKWLKRRDGAQGEVEMWRARALAAPEAEAAGDAGDTVAVQRPLTSGGRAATGSVEELWREVAVLRVENQNMLHMQEENAAMRRQLQDFRAALDQDKVCTWPRAPFWGVARRLGRVGRLRQAGFG
jgi:hypothetical protein